MKWIGVAICMFAWAHVTHHPEAYLWTAILIAVFA